MALREIANDLKASVALENDAYTSDQDGATIDMQGYGSVMFLADVGESNDTLSGSVYVELEVEHSDNGSSWDDVADSDLTSSVTGSNTGTFAVVDDPAEDVAIYKVGYIGEKRYVRVVANFTGTHSNGIPLGVVAVQGHALAKPVS